METVNEMICCGETLESKFCPHCGTKASPLCGLIYHCRMQAKQAAYKYENRKEVRGDSDSPRSMKYKHTAEKWTMWADAIESLLSAEGQQP